MITASADADLEVADCGRTTPAIGWASPIRIAPSIAATAQLRLPGPDPRTRGLRRRGTVRRRGLVPRKYGFGGRGFGGGGLWAHDAGHRLGVAYSNRALNSRYGAVSAASARSSYAASAGSRYSSAPRAGAAQAGGWSRFGQAGSNRSTPAYGGGSAYRASPSNGGNYGGSRTVPSYRSSPSYGGS